MDPDRGEMEVVEDIVIVGAGIAGLSTSLGLHRLGIGSLVLESSESLRNTGFALTTWSNAWKALDALGIAHSLRQHHPLLQGVKTISLVSGLSTSELSIQKKGSNGDHEVRCVKRKLLMEALVKDLPSGTIRFSSKVASIEDSGYSKLVHLADGSTIKTKVLIGCDGVNSVVAKWLGFNKAHYVGRSAIRGFADFRGSHGIEVPKRMQLFGKGVRSGISPCDATSVYWFFTYIPSADEKQMDDNPAKMKEFVTSKLGKAPEQVKAVIDITELDSIICSPLRFRPPWELLYGNINKGNVCIAGDALHPMTPDIGQGGCSALEDGVVLARCLAKALSEKPSGGTEEENKRREYERIEMGLKKFTGERRWRGIQLITTAYLVGFIQQSGGSLMKFVREKILASYIPGLLFKMADFDCGKLGVS